MPIRNMGPPESFAEMEAAAAFVLIDVRTPEEFADGHPKGALNIPWAVMDAGSGRLAPNPEFVSVVQRHAATDAPVFLSCLSGVRSMNACRDLEAAGYADLTNVDCGYGGKRDMTGAVVAPGWRDSGLPVGTDGPTYDSLS